MLFFIDIVSRCIVHPIVRYNKRTAVLDTRQPKIIYPERYLRTTVDLGQEQLFIF